MPARRRNGHGYILTSMHTGNKKRDAENVDKEIGSNDHKDVQEDCED